MLVKKAQPLAIECVVRGYLAGSGWKEYQKSGTIGGMPLRPGYEMAGKLDEPIFTPSTKAAVGAHDENISYPRTVALLGSDLADQVRELPERSDLA